MLSPVDLALWDCPIAKQEEVIGKRRRGHLPHRTGSRYPKRLNFRGRGGSIISLRVRKAHLIGEVSVHSVLYEAIWYARAWSLPGLVEALKPDDHDS